MNSTHAPVREVSRMTPMFWAFIATTKITYIRRPILRGKKYDYVRSWFGAYST